MPIDVQTLYYLIVGTTLTGAALMAWERRYNVAHRRVMGIWALGLCCVSLGCVLRLLTAVLPHFAAIGLSNLAVLAGYAAITAATTLFARGALSRRTLGVHAAAAAAWLVLGQYAAVETRIALTGVATATLCFQAFAALGPKTDGIGLLASRQLVRCLFAFHGLFFLARVVATLAVPAEAVDFHGLNFAVTMVEGILWSTLAPPAFLIMAREETERRLTAVSQTDFLTGIDNRRAFMAKAAMLVSGPNAGASLVAVDLDHFKTINDRHGHAIGDEVLKTFCRTVEARLTPGDVFGRLGGEEFAILFHACDAGEAQQRAAAISRLYTMEIAQRFDLLIRATVSGGVAECRPGADVDRLLREADEAMYRAKQAGRDRTLVAEAPAAEPPAARARVA